MGHWSAVTEHGWGMQVEGQWGWGQGLEDRRVRRGDQGKINGKCGGQERGSLHRILRGNGIQMKYEGYEIQAEKWDVCGVERWADMRTESRRNSVGGTKFK